MIKNSIGSEPQHFKYLELLGEGGFAKVYKARCLQPGVKGLEVAIKEISKVQISKDKKLASRVEQEINVHSELQHPSIVKFYTTFEDDDKIYLILEYCENGSLAKYLKSEGPMSEADAHHVIKEIIEGLQYLHSKCILHRDLSLGNILLKKGMEIKIADFGMATKLSKPDEKKHTMLGTANFMSPEVVTRNSHGAKADYWALGCILYSLLVGKPPFEGQGVVATLANVIMSDLKIPEHISKDAKKLICDLLKKDPKDRMDLNAALKYSFFTKYKTKPHCNKNCDSGIGSVSSSTALSSRSNYRPSRTLDSGMDSCYKRDAFCRSRSMSRNTTGSETTHSMSCSYQSNDSFTTSCKYASSRGQVEGCPKSPPSKLRNSKSKTGPVKELKSKLQTLPSRKEFHYSPTLEVVTSSAKGQERSASEERRKQDYQRVLCQDTEFCPRQCEESFEKNSLLYNRLEDFQIRGCSNTPFPYPTHILENIIDDNLRKSYISSYESGSPSKSNTCYRNTGCYECPPKLSCSHDRYCTSENQNCSHEVLCPCRKIQHPVQVYSNCSHHSQNHYSTNQKNSSEKKSFKNIVLPLSTMRIGPKRYVTKNAVASVLSNGQVCLEFLKTRNNKKYVANVCVISPNGMMIFIYKTKGQLPVSDEPPPIPENPQEVQYFSYESLPEVHWKKYLLASRFVNIIRAKTPKIILYTKQAKFIMMENAPKPDFEMLFYDGGKITQVSDRVNIVDKSGKIGDINQLEEGFQIMWEEFVIQKARCDKLEKALESLKSDDSEESFFPAIIGKKPFHPLNEVSNKENVTPPSIRSSTLNKVIENMQSYPHSINTTGSPYESSKNSVKSHSDLKYGINQTQNHIRKRSMDDILVNLKSVPKVVNGKIVAEYKDGLEMWSSQHGTDVYFYDTQSGKKFKNIKHNPDLLKRICFDLKGILLYVEFEQRRIAR